MQVCTEIKRRAKGQRHSLQDNVRSFRYMLILNPRTVWLIRHTLVSHHLSWQELDSAAISIQNLPNLAYKSLPDHQMYSPHVFAVLVRRDERVAVLALVSLCMFIVLAVHVYCTRYACLLYSSKVLETLSESGKELLCSSSKAWCKRHNMKGFRGHWMWKLNLIVPLSARG
jgi:hypothetical protein